MALPWDRAAAARLAFGVGTSALALLLLAIFNGGSQSSASPRALKAIPIGGDPQEVVSSMASFVRVKSAMRNPTTNVNPFTHGKFYVNPTYAASLNSSIALATGQVRANLESMRDVPSAYWLDVKEKIEGSGSRTMQGILAEAAGQDPAPLVTFIVYDLPNRDCHAKASNGQICCQYKDDGTCDYDASGDCHGGLDSYKTQYIDRIVEVLKEYEERVPIVLVIEPDSLPNLVTNMGDPRCANSVQAYENGVKYAVQKIGQEAPLVTMYVDAGHGGWLGWENNMKKFAELISRLEIWMYIRGFATNVAGYQALGEEFCPTFDHCLQQEQRQQPPPCCPKPEDNDCSFYLHNQWNPSHNEIMYAMHLREAMSRFIPGFMPHMVIDTGRNGQTGIRDNCAMWCNIRGAGIGVRPTAETADTDLIDAYYWLKTPGESDGCTQVLPDGKNCGRFDYDCGSSDSLGSRQGEPRAPEAGAWFDYQIQMLARNAIMAT